MAESVLEPQVAGQHSSHSDRREQSGADERLEALGLNKKHSWFSRMPIVRDLRIAVGWQKAMLIVGLVLCALFILLAVFAPWIAPYGYAQTRGADGVAFPTQAAPSAEHIWGTTVGGFDVFSRVIWGARTAVIAIVVAVLLSIFIGVFLGLVSGYYGGWLDRILVVIADAIYSFPSLLLAILMAIMISGGQSSLFGGILASGISITVVYIPQYFRTIRAEVVRMKSSAFIESSKVVGASSGRIMVKHLLRNSTRTLPVILTLNSSEAILTLAGLGFLGFGIEPTAAAEWGYDLNRSVADVTAGIWWTAVFPGVAIVLIVLGITLVGESLNDLADPRLRARKSAGEVAGSIEDTAVDSSEMTKISASEEAEATPDVLVSLATGNEEALSEAVEAVETDATERTSNDHDISREFDISQDPEIAVVSRDVPDESQGVAHE